MGPAVPPSGTDGPIVRNRWFHRRGTTVPKRGADIGTARGMKYKKQETERKKNES